MFAMYTPSRHLEICCSRHPTFPYNKFSDFFLKSEGKEIERKRKKRDVGGGAGVTS